MKASKRYMSQSLNPNPTPSFSSNSPSSVDDNDSFPSLQRKKVTPVQMKVDERSDSELRSQSSQKSSKTSLSLTFRKQISQTIRKTIYNNPSKAARYFIYLLWFSFVVYFLLSSLAISFKLDLHVVSFNKGGSIKNLLSKQISSSSDNFPTSIVSNIEDPYEHIDLTQQVSLSQQRKKVSKTQEKQFACEETNCINSCYKKISSKCLKQDSCIKIKTKECKKKCRKERCENRCAIEPPFGYVEREMKLDQCKEDCHSSSKCIDKCELDFMPCKHKCRTFLSRKYQCDNEPVVSLPMTNIDNSDDDTMSIKDKDGYIDEEKDNDKEKVVETDILSVDI